MPAPRLIATDLDGTLLGADGQVSERTRETIGAAADAGAVIVAATGRSRHSALPKLAGVHGIRWVICSNGAMIWDRDHDEVAIHRPIAGHTAAHAMVTLRRAVPEVAIGWETEAGFGFDERFLEQPPSIDEYGLRNDVPEPGHGTEVTKLVLTLHGVTGSERLEAEVRPHMPVTVTTAASSSTFLETTAAGVTKASTLAMLATRLAVDAGDVVAFGDQHNDIEMLQWAGRSYAMANAQQRVQAAADSLAPSNADDGVAAVIERWLHRPG